MSSSRIKFCLFAIVLVYSTECGQSAFQNFNSEEWNNYKDTFDKDYSSPAAEANAFYYYNYNMRLIANHNLYYQRDQRTYRLAANNFTDMRLTQFNALFPKTTQPIKSRGISPPTVLDPPLSYDPSDQGYTFNIEDQGRVCNGGWAYATAKSIEAMQAMQVGDFTPDSLSAQNLIDCAGRSTGCTKQVPLNGFDYLTLYNQPLYLESSYLNNNAQAVQGMCVPTGVLTTTLTNYSTIANGADATLKRYVGNSFPVVIEFNPTSFEFMHYSEGIFQQPATGTGSHFMPVIGYGTDAKTNLDYWIVQNSFGNLWGEGGIIRILRSSSKPLTKSAIFPSV